MQNTRFHQKIVMKMLICACCLINWVNFFLCMFVVLLVTYTSLFRLLQHLVCVWLAKKDVPCFLCGEISKFVWNFVLKTKLRVMKYSNVKGLWCQLCQLWVYEWYKQFQESREDIENDTKSEHSSTSITDKTAEKLKRLCLLLTAESTLERLLRK